MASEIWSRRRALSILVSRLGFVYTALRPFLLPIFTFLALVDSKRRYLHASLALLVGRGLAACYVHRANLWKRVGLATSGVFLSPKASKEAESIASNIQDVIHEHASPWWAYGDLATVSYFAAGYAGPPKPRFVRELIPSERDGEVFAVDWLGRSSSETPQDSDAVAESEEPSETHLVLIVAGIGGDVNSPYVRCLATHLRTAHATRGCVVGVLNPRGLSSSPPVKRVEALFDPAQDAELHQLVMRSSREFDSVSLMGFSLGAVQVCRYAARADLPANLRGGLAFSGAFKIDFATSDRYESVYQNGLIVPSLIQDILSKYDTQLRERFPGDAAFHANLRAARNYRELYEALYVPLGIRSGPYENFKAALEGDVSSVARPLLVVTALDDPLHRVDHLGLNGAFAAREGEERLDPSPSHHVVLAVTESGGHVAWPVAGRNEYYFMRNVASRFLTSVWSAV